jgi:hypothetical protein
MIEESKVRKPASPAGRYLLYAIGEIILVVIGILIALQINNWNEQRKEQLIVQDLKSAILSDLKMDLVTIDSTLHKANSYLMSLDSLKQRITAPSVTDEEVISAIKNDYLPYGNRFAGFNDYTYRSSSASGSFALLDQQDRVMFYSYYLLQSSTKEILDTYYTPFLDKIQALNEDFPLNVPFGMFNTGRIYEQKWTNIDFNKLTSRFHVAATSQVNYFRLLNNYLPKIRIETEHLIKKLEETQ